MAASSREGAPAQVAAGLATAFRRHHARRRLLRQVRVAALAGCFVLAALLLMRMRPQPSKAANVGMPSPEISNKVPEKTVAPPVAAAPKRPAAKRVSTEAKTPPPAAREFVALPAYDPGIPMDELRVVRVQLPASALWQMGAPLNSDTANRRMLADFVVGQDGTPYAVRLVQ